MLKAVAYIITHVDSGIVRAADPNAGATIHITRPGDLVKIVDTILDTINIGVTPYSWSQWVTGYRTKEQHLQLFSLLQLHWAPSYKKVIPLVTSILYRLD